MSANHNIGPKEMIAWFRNKAREFNGIADQLENTFSGTNGAPSPQRIVGPTRPLDVNTIREFLGARASRPGSIAAKLHVDREDVQAVIDNHNDVFEVIGKGWVKVRGT